MAEAGQTPAFWGVVSPNNIPEQDNTFRYMLSRHFYVSRFGNTVYAGQSAVMAAEREARTNQWAGIPLDSAVYRVAHRGMPMTPLEVRKIDQTARNNGMSP